MSNEPTRLFTLANTEAAYQLRYHFGWHTHARKPTFEDARTRTVLDDALTRVAAEHGFHVLGHQVEPRAVRAIVSLRPEHAPAHVTRTIKGNLAADARRLLELRQIWSRGWFLRSVGSVTADVVRSYVAGQIAHHRALPVEQPQEATLARYHADVDSAKLRSAAHVVFEYNVHVVFGTLRRFDFLDREVSQQLVDYLRFACEKHQWVPWDIEVVWNHVHLFLGLRPADSPQDAALSLMNNSAYFLHRRYAGALRDAKIESVWQPGFYVRTAGSATTAQVKAFLGSSR